MPACFPAGRAGYVRRVLAHHEARTPDDAITRFERVSATFAKIAKPLRSGSFGMSNPETIDFDNFYFQLAPLSIPVRVKQSHSPGVSR